MPGFAERKGHRPKRSIIQTNDLDDETRMAIWNTLHILREIVDDYERQRGVDIDRPLLKRIWTFELRRARDEFPLDYHVWNEIKALVLKGSWVDSLDMVEAVVRHLGRVVDARHEDLPGAIANAFDEVFADHLVGYRFVNLEITPLDSNQAAEAVQQAIDDASPLAGARGHLERAVELLASRSEPDHPNSIKESISAVEAIARALTGKNTLGDAIKVFEASGVSVHPALRAGWIKLYAWTSDERGVRHGSIEVADADQMLAKYMLVTCSAFVSYLIEAGRRAELL